MEYGSSYLFRVAGVSLISACLAVTPLKLKAQATVSHPAPVAPPRVSWIDKNTGHKIIQLTPERGSRGLYFNENAFTSDGKEMVYIVGQSVRVLNLASHETHLLVSGLIVSFVVARKAPVVYFMRPKDTTLYAVGVDSGQITKLAELPQRALISTLNADETLVAGTYTEIDVPQHPVDPQLKPSSVRAVQMDARLADHVPMVLFTVNVKTGEVRTVLHSTDWLNHPQFSPTDPTLLMYCHEGLWWKVDRIWTVRTDGTQNQLIHTRTVDNEIAGHEFWDPDGVTIWYDLQIPHGANFYLASYNTITRDRHWYHVERDAWSIHYNVVPGDAIFCGDGGDESQVAKSKNGQWIELFTPSLDPAPAGVDPSGLIGTGAFETERLANMAKHNYKIEPNVRFSPDHKMVIFTSNVLGETYVFGVEVNKSKGRSAGL